MYCISGETLFGRSKSRGFAGGSAMATFLCYFSLLGWFGPATAEEAAQQVRPARKKSPTRTQRRIISSNHCRHTRPQRPRSTSRKLERTLYSTCLNITVVPGVDDPSCSKLACERYCTKKPFVLSFCSSPFHWHQITTPWPAD